MEIKEVDSDMSIVDQMYASFCKCAKTIPGFEVGQKEDVKYDITELANAYLKAYDENNQEDMNKYISALMVRYWHMVPYLWDKSKSSKLDMEDMVVWIWEGFAKAFKYRSWLDPNKAVSKDPKGAEKCFNQCITSVRQYWYKHFNTNQAKVNYNTISLDSLYESLGDSVEDGLPQEEIYTSSDICRDIILSLVKEGKIFDAIVIDKICFDEVCKKTKTTKQTKIINDDGELLEDVTSYNYAFDSKKLISCLKSITEEYIINFSRIYGVSTQKIHNVLKSKCAKSHKLKENVELALTSLRNNKKVLSLVC